MAISADAPAEVRRRVRHERFWNLPNAISVGRIAAMPLLLLAPLFPDRTGGAVIGLGFLAVALSDLLDGYIARRDGTVTRVGKLLDPMADKLLVTTALIVLVAMGRVPLWGVALVVIIVGREIAVTGLRAMASAEGVILSASSLGKWKTGFQTAAITGLLIHYSWLAIPMHALGMALLVVASGFALWSGYDYFAAHLGTGRDTQR